MHGMTHPFSVTRASFSIDLVSHAKNEGDGSTTLIKDSLLILALHFFRAPRPLICTSLCPAEVQAAGISFLYFFPATQTL
jgi:hypothetical protein